MLVILQHNVAHLGIATGFCLSEAATMHLPKWVSRPVLRPPCLLPFPHRWRKSLGLLSPLKCCLESRFRRCHARTAVGIGHAVYQLLHASNNGLSALFPSSGCPSFTNCLLSISTGQQPRSTGSSQPSPWIHGYYYDRFGSRGHASQFIPAFGDHSKPTVEPGGRKDD